MNKIKDLWSKLKDLLRKIKDSFSGLLKSKKKLCFAVLGAVIFIAGIIAIAIFSIPPENTSEIAVLSDSKMLELKSDGGESGQLNETVPDVEEGMEIFGDAWNDDIVNENDNSSPRPSPSKKPSSDSGQNSTPDASNTVSPSPTPKPEFPYMIYVSKNSYTVAILGVDDNGEYTKVLRKFSTGIGRSSAQTRAGTFKISSKERWHKWGNTSYSPYSTKHSGGLWFHGPIYNSMDSNSMKPGSYNEIGTSCSSGCLRTTCSAAAWIYYNCKAGTTVIIANDSKYSSSRPSKVPADQTWDPTDPGATPEIPVTSFTLNHTSATLNIGNTLTLSVNDIKPSDTNTKKFIFSSSNTSVATVDSNGNIAAVGEGTAVITVTADDVSGISRRCNITVNPPPPTPTPPPDPTPTPSIEPTPTPSTEPPDPTPTPDPPDPTDPPDPPGPES